jgi:hypothetical protein
MVTQLVVQSFNGSSTGITGSFQPSQKTVAGCQCAQRWTYQPTPGGPSTTFAGTCITDQQGTWCKYEPGSCINHTGNNIDLWRLKVILLVYKYWEWTSQMVDKFKDLPCCTISVLSDSMSEAGLLIPTSAWSK